MAVRKGLCESVGKKEVEFLRGSTGVLAWRGVCIIKAYTIPGIEWRSGVLSACSRTNYRLCHIFPTHFRHSITRISEETRSGSP